MSIYPLENRVTWNTSSREQSISCKRLINKIKEIVQKLKTCIIPPIESSSNNSSPGNLYGDSSVTSISKIPEFSSLSPSNHLKPIPEELECE
mgnify:CR=1 FL=1